MTIALGMTFRDGFILAADRQITASGSHKYEAEKIFVIEGIHWNVFLTYCDSPAVAKEAAENIEAALAPFESGFSSEDYEPPKFRDIKETIENTLNGISNKHYDSPPVQLLILIECSMEPTTMFLYQDKAFCPAPDFQVLGCADSSIIHYLTQAYSKRDSLEYGQKLAAYMVSKAIDFIDRVGKGIDILLVKQVGTWDWLSKEEVREILTRIEEKEVSALRKIVSG
jgi:20S proteasome alpha/beta subunit